MGSDSCPTCDPSVPESWRGFCTKCGRYRISNGDGNHEQSVPSTHPVPHRIETPIVRIDWRKVFIGYLVLIGVGLLSALAYRPLVTRDVAQSATRLARGAPWTPEGFRQEYYAELLRQHPDLPERLQRIISGHQARVASTSAPVQTDVIITDLSKKQLAVLRERILKLHIDSSRPAISAEKTPDKRKSGPLVSLRVQGEQGEVSLEANAFRIHFFDPASEAARVELADWSFALTQSHNGRANRTLVLGSGPVTVTVDSGGWPQKVDLTLVESSIGDAGDLSIYSFTSDQFREYQIRSGASGRGPPNQKTPEEILGSEIVGAGSVHEVFVAAPLGDMKITGVGQVVSIWKATSDSLSPIALHEELENLRQEQERAEREAELKRRRAEDARRQAEREAEIERRRQEERKREEEALRIAIAKEVTRTQDGIRKAIERQFAGHEVGSINPKSSITKVWGENLVIADWPTGSGFSPYLYEVEIDGGTWYWRNGVLAAGVTLKRDKAGNVRADL